MSKKDKEKVDAQRVRTGTKKQLKEKKVGRHVSIFKTKTTLASQKKALKTAKRQIASLHRNVKQLSDSNDTSDNDQEDDAGNLFGEREEKDWKKKKKKSKK